MQAEAAQRQLSWFENSRSERLALSDRTLLVAEDELPNFVPYSVAEIRKMRKTGILPYLNDPLGRKRRVLYNLRDIEATLLSGRPTTGPLVKQVDWDKIAV